MRTVPVFDLDLHLSPHVVVVHGVVERVSQSFQLVVWTAAAASRCRAAPRGDGMAADTQRAFYELTTNPPRTVSLSSSTHSLAIAGCDDVGLHGIIGRVGRVAL